MIHTNYPLYVLKSVSKGYSIYIFVLLPVFYAKGIVSSAQVGLIGALSIASIILGAYTVVRKLHAYETRSMLYIGATSLCVITAFLLLSARIESIPFLSLSYSAAGFMLGVTSSAVDSVTAAFTTKGKRYTVIARLAVATDVVRIVLPVAIAAALSVSNMELTFAIVLIATLLFLKASSTLPKGMHAQDAEPSSKSLRGNKLFRFFLGIEFLDSFSSSQLFVFLPILFLSKGYSVENSLIMQTSIFVGYLVGRILVSRLANRFSGQSAVAFAELGMAVSIGLLLLSDNLILLYSSSFLLGIFARGTSPAIKALTFDSLPDNHMKRGVAAYLMAGDSGSALAQLLFGLLVGWLGVSSPFIISIFAALIIVTLLRLKAPRKQIPKTA